MSNSKLARNNAQLRQIIRLGRCAHPENSKVINLQYDVKITDDKVSVTENGFIEHCSDCDKILRIWEPE